MAKIKKKFVLVVLVFILSLFLIVKNPSFSSSFRMQLIDFFELPLKISSSILHQVKNIINIGGVFRENVNFKARVDKLEKQVIDYQEVLNENMRLRKLLTFKNEAVFSTIAARVIAREAGNLSSSIIIDKGKSEGIRADMAVITDLGLVGKIAEAGSSTSKVVLINDANLNVAALIQRNRDQGTLSGTILGNCRMRYLALDSDVEPGDQVLTSGLGDIFPKGILIGEITEVSSDASGLMKSCLVRPAVHLAKLEEILIVIK